MTKSTLYRRHHMLSLLVLLLITGSCTSAQQVQKPAGTPHSTQRPGELTQADSLQARSDYIRGITEYELNNYKNAVSYLNRAYVKIPGDPAINYALADTYLKLDDMANAEYYAHQAVAMDSTNKWYRLKLAEINQANGNLKGAENQLTRISGIYPGDLDILGKIADLQRRQGEYSASNATLNKMLSAGGEDPQLYYQKFLNFNRLGRQDSALMTLERIHRLDPDNTTTIQTLGQFYKEVGQPDKAISLLHAALHRMPGETDLALQLADTYMDQARWDSAGTLLTGIVASPSIEASRKVKVIDRMLRASSQHSQTHELNSLTDTLITTFLRANPGNATAHAMAARALIRKGNQDGAIDQLKASARLDSTNDQVWQQLIQLLYARQDFAGVIAEGKRAAAASADNTFIHFAVGSAFMAQNDSRSAIPWLRKASKLPARSNFKSIILGVLGDAYSAAGDTTAADSSYSRAVTIDQTNDNAFNNYAYFLARQNKHLDEARTMALKALSIAPNNAAYLDTAGWIYFKMGDYDKAREYILKSVREQPGDAEVMEHLGDVYQKLNDRDNARYWWKKALEADSTRSYLKSRLSQ